jgi:hypothetical protein
MRLDRVKGREARVFPALGKAAGPLKVMNSNLSSGHGAMFSMKLALTANRTDAA